MIRVASQLTFCSPEKILRRVVLERDEQNVINRIFSLDDSPFESAQTLFFDGIISAEIVSLKQNISSKKIESLVSDYTYFDLSKEAEIFEIQTSNKPLLLDFGTDLIEEINVILAKLANKLPDVPVFDLIAACVYFPQVLLGKHTDLIINRQTNLILWENIDLPNRRLIPTSKIRKI